MRFPLKSATVLIGLFIAMMIPMSLGGPYIVATAIAGTPFAR